MQVRVGSRCILSGVRVEQEMAVPGGWLFHTVPVTLASTPAFVTVAFHITDDMKFSCGAGQAGNLQYGGRLLANLFQLTAGLNPGRVFHSSGPASLWSARLFTAQSSMAESFQQTVELARLASGESGAVLELTAEQQLYSMEDIVSMKDGRGILQFRKLLNKLCAGQK